MKYWILTSEYPPFYGGGISTYCAITATAMMQKGINVTVFVADVATQTYKVTTDADKPVVIRFNPDFCRYRSVLGYTANLSYSFAEIVKLFIDKQGEPDFIETQDYLGISYYLQQFKLTGLLSLQNTPIIVTLHSPAFIYLEYNRVPTYRFPEFWTCEMEKAAIRSADILISPTYFLVEELKKYLLFEKEIHVIPNPFIAAPIKQPPVFKRNKIIYYGKLSAQKGSFKLLEYFDELWRNGFQHPLYIIGGTDIVYHPEEQTMQQLIEQHYGHYLSKGLIKFEGKITASEITDRLSDAHLLIAPSIIDNLPYAVLECLARMKPVLTSVQGGQREIIADKETGFLFDHEEPSSFSLKLLSILDLSDDELMQVGRKGYASLDQYHPDVILQKKLSLLQQFKVHEKKSIKQEFPFIFQEPFIAKKHHADKLLSVVIPYYNMGMYIEECINSISVAHYAEKEVIIVNDGSTDTLSLHKLDILSNQKGIKIINQANKGVAAARNAGALAATGRFLAFIDADDRVSKDYFSKAIFLLEKYVNVFFVGCWVQYFENSSAIWATYTPQPPYLLVHNPVNSSALIYEREAFLQGGVNDKTVDYGLEDYESVINLVKAGYNGIVIPEVHFFYRVRSNSMIRSISRVKWLYSYKYIAQKHADYYAKFAVPVTNLLNANGPGFTFDNPTFERSSLHRSKYYRFLLPYARKLSGKYPYAKRILLNISRFIDSNK